MTKKSGELTPMMKQFYDIKAKHPEALLLFRCGDFYETYCEDAVKAADILGITLTKRNNGASQGDAMAGFPYHALDTYLPKLIRRGQRVAICDQLEDPKKAKTLVKRGITELVTPGIAMQDNVLKNKENNFLCAVALGRGAVGISFLDISTGEFMCGEGNYDYAVKLVENFQPKEVIYDRTRERDFVQRFPARLCTQSLDDWAFTLQNAEQKLHKHFHVKTMKGFGVDHLKNGLCAAGAIMSYLEQTLHNNLSHITRLQRLDTTRYVRLDNFTMRSLELLAPIADEGVSLLDVIDRTATAMGGRLLRRWVSFPLKDRQAIEARLNIVEYYLRNVEFRDIVDEQLHRIADLERLVSKVSTRRVTPREMRQLMEALDAIQRLMYECSHADDGALNDTAHKLDACHELKERIGREIVVNPPQLLVKGGVVASGVSAELDDLREIQQNGKAYLLKIQQREIEETGIASLKIGYNNVFGYYLEVRNTYKDHVPSSWIRKQTLAQAERYITEELKEYEEKILGAEEKIISLEQHLYDELVDYATGFINQLQQDAVLVARLDCLLSFALVSLQNRYNRPVVDDSTVLDIRGGRHPVIETQMAIGEKYIPNDVTIQGAPQAHPKPTRCAPFMEGGCNRMHSTGSDASECSPKTSIKGSDPLIDKIGEQNASEQSISLPSLAEGQGGGSVPQIIIITGPNMAGKSALLRQTALIVLMAQIGCFVPADSARVGLVDKIFTRVGASDNIAAGESTFMVEMTEAANILNNVTDHSLVLFDELGRGTSTYDGISIAWAIVEYLAQQAPLQLPRGGGNLNTTTNENASSQSISKVPPLSCRGANALGAEVRRGLPSPRTLFATHYHELNEMAQYFPAIKNYNVSVVEKDGKVVFLRKLVEGGSEHSFGIHVAEIAGMPRQIIERANVILRQLEEDNSGVGQEAATAKPVSPAPHVEPAREMSFFQLDDPVLTQIRDTLLHLDVDNLTPLQALNKLNEIKGILKG